MIKLTYNIIMLCKNINLIQKSTLHKIVLHFLFQESLTLIEALFGYMVLIMRTLYVSY